MKKTIKLLILGDFNFTYNAHHATNIAIEHASISLKVDTNYYWMRLHEAANLKVTDFREYDGIWVAPGPFENEFFLDEIMRNSLEAHIPILITGRSFKVFIENVIRLYNLNSNQEKAISENLFQGTNFDRIEVIPNSRTLLSLYKNKSRDELSNSRYSIYPQVLKELEDVMDIEAINHLEEPEIISLKSRPFCVATMSLPQITSTRESPHPLVLSFINYIKNVQ